MSQHSWLSEPIERIEANPVQSADSPGIGVALSGQRYVLKVSHPGHPRLQATEWICHALALAVHLPVPMWSRCTLPDSREAFGSRMEGAVTALQVPPFDLGGFINPAVMPQTMALDMFVGNEDRHAGNWLPTASQAGVLLRPIDFSRALLWRWPLTPPPWPANSNSHTYYHLAAVTGNCPSAEAKITVGKIAALPKDTWRSIIEGVPTDWLTEQERRELVNWWWSPMWQTRCKWIDEAL